MPSGLMNTFVSGNSLTGTIPPIPSSLTRIRAESNQFTAFADSSLPLGSSLFYFQFNNNLIEAIPDLLNATNMQAVLGYNNLIGVIPSGCLSNLDALINIQLQNNLLPQSEIDRILQEIWINEQNRSPKISGCVLNLGGTGNSAPSAIGIAAKDNLVASGNWTVTTN